MDAAPNPSAAIHALGRSSHTESGRLLTHRLSEATPCVGGELK